ncbi:MAG: Flp1 family type IVb pilin [Acetatifactor sp.]
MEKLIKKIEAEKRNRVEAMWEDRRELKGIHKFLTEEEGMGTVEVILIIVVLVGLVIIFKDQITEIVNNLFDRITKQTGKI